MAVRSSAAQPRMSRRQFVLSACLGGAAASLLTACGGAASVTAVTSSAAAGAQPATAAASSAATTAAQTTSAASAGSPSSASAASSAATSAAATASAAPAAAGQPGSLTVSYRSGNQDYFAERTKVFMTMQPDIKVVLQPIAGSNNEYYPKLTAEFAANSASDVFWVSTGFGLYDNYAYAQQLMGVDSYVAADKVDLTQWFKGAIDTLHLDGKMYALPWGMHPGEIGLYYNQDMLKAEGVDPPSVDKETYQSLQEKAVKLTKSSGSHTSVWGIASGTGPFDNGLIEFVRSYGGDFLSDDKKKSAATTAPVQQAFEWLYELRAKYHCNPLLSQTPAGGVEDAFVGGTIAMFTSGVWDMSLTQKIGNRFKMNMSLIPKGPTGIRGTMAHVDTIAAYAKTKQPDDAFKLIEFLTNKESGVQNALANSFFGARPDVWADPRPKQKFGTMVDTWQSATINTMPLDEPYNFRLTQLNTAMTNTLAPLWNAETTVSAITPKLEQAMNAVLDLPRQ